MRFWVVSRKVRLRLTAYGTFVLIAVLSIAAANLVQQRLSPVQATPAAHMSTPSGGDGSR